MFLRRLLFFVLPCFLVAGCGDPNGVISASNARKTAEKAYLYAYPMAGFAEIISSSFLDASSPSYQAAPGKMHAVYDPSADPSKVMKGLTPDLPYNVIFLDLRDDAYVVTLPSVEPNRYYSVEIIDMYTHIPSYLGTRQDGNQGGHFLIAGPRFRSDLPSTIKRAVHVDTDMALLVFRTQPLHPADAVKTKAIQNAYKVEPFSLFSGEKTAAVRSAQIYWPEPSILNERDKSIFSILSDLLRYCPVLSSELLLRADFSEIHIFPGEMYDAGALPPDVRTAVHSGILSGQKKLSADIPNRTDFPYAFGSEDYVGNDYLRRASASSLPVFGHFYREIYTQPITKDAKGRFLSGDKRYRITFKGGNMPPVKAFWSLSLFDRDGRVYDNPKKRYFISSIMNTPLAFEDNGDLILYIQKESPGKDRESNWLPAPAGDFSLVFLGYLPQDALLEKQWPMPPVSVID